MLAMVETRMMSSSPQGLDQLTRMIRRFRNSPSIFIWSLGNEEREEGTIHGQKMVAAMRVAAHQLDPTRLVTAAMNNANTWGKGVSNSVDVQGFNYSLDGIDDFHRAHPAQPTIGTETCSALTTRGEYRIDKLRGYMSAYDVNKPEWGELAEEWWRFYAARPFLSGGFLWTGFDYRGEPTPYGYPCISSHFGILDTCGFPKDTAFYYRAWWGAEPVLHLFPHWNWTGREGQPIEVWAHTNLDEVELFLNNTSQGKKKVEPNGHLSWTVPYQPGTIEAHGTRGTGTLSDRRETTNEPARLRLTPDRSSLYADGSDVSVVSVEVLDARDRIVPTAGNHIAFELVGSGRILGVGNGDPSSHEPDKASQRSAFNGRCMVLVQTTDAPGELRLRATSPSLLEAAVVLTSAAVVHSSAAE